MDLNQQFQGSGANTAKPDVEGTAASTVHDVLEHPDQAVDKVKQVAAQIPHAAQAPIHHAVHAAANAAASMRDAAEPGLLASATQYIQANPRRSLGIAFATGLLISRIVR